ncbi:MAG: hypothetical protein R2827_10080 [Bdellovibrionales bacterium]
MFFDRLQQRSSKPSSSAEQIGGVPQYCSASKEFIVSYEYLKGQSYFDQKWAQSVSQKVAQGCDGAARRFIKAMKVLMQVGVYTDDAAQFGIQLAQSTDNKADVFFQTFQKAYLKKYLDLDVQTSLELARRLSYDFNGSSQIAEEDFSNFIQFCAGKKSLGLSIPTCSDFALRMTVYGEGKNISVYPEFIKAFEFMTSKDGPEQPSNIALEMTERLMKIHPLAATDFVTAYTYSVREKGLDLDRGQALAMAEELANTGSRLPASTPKVK